jgi:hypothetical protein
MVRNFFKDIDCFTLVRPWEDEAMLQNLSKLRQRDLRLKFNQQIDLLRSKLFKKVKHKALRGKNISGGMLVELA